ncbi:conserved hypothetical protein [Ricinus communis]|uniref:Uncharacterized protein n=1 Tax=Ricinus communis TaxID=3988 RepID=B9SEC3_RICCO|nr:conserved hypothetical protein [Ricinus communis]
MVKLKTDGACSGIGRRASAGGVLRDSRGEEEADGSVENPCVTEAGEDDSHNVLENPSKCEPQAIKILHDEMQWDIIKIGNLVRTKVIILLLQESLGCHLWWLFCHILFTGEDKIETTRQPRHVVAKIRDHQLWKK